jgi:hypothetical protein
VKHRLRDLSYSKRASSCCQDYLVSPSQYYVHIGCRHCEVYSRQARPFCISNHCGLDLWLSVSCCVSVFPGFKGFIMLFIFNLVPSTCWLGVLEDVRPSVWSWFLHEDYVTPCARRLFSLVKFVRLLRRSTPFQSIAFDPF